MKKNLLLIWVAYLGLMAVLPCLAPAAPSGEAAKDHFSQGIAALSQGNPALAVENFTEALKLDPEMAEAYINRGIAHLKLEQYVDAVTDLDHALELAPQAPEAYYNRALAYSRQGLYDKALED